MMGTPIWFRAGSRMLYISAMRLLIASSGGSFLIFFLSAVSLLTSSASVKCGVLILE